MGDCHLRSREKGESFCQLNRQVSMSNKVLISIVFIFFIDRIYGLFKMSGVIQNTIIVSLLVLFLYFLQGRKEKKIYKQENRFFIVFLFAICLNLLFSYINRGQTLIQVMHSHEFREFFLLLSFYVFCIIKPSIKEVERIIKIAYVFFLFCFFLEYFIFYPKPIFKLLALTVNEHRFRMVGQLIGFIGYFYYLNIILISKKTIWHDYILMFGGGLFVILLGFRLHIFALFVVSLLMIYKVKGFNIRSFGLLVVIGIVSLIFSFSEIGSYVISNIINRQKSETFGNEDYVRLQQFYYFSKVHFISVTDYIFGSGIPAGGSNYEKQMLSLVVYDSRGEFVRTIAQWRDWGLLGLSWMMGLPLMCVLYYYIWSAITKVKNKRFYYISAFYFALLLTSLANIEFYREGAFVFHGLMFYLIHLSAKVCSNKKVNYENRYNYTTIIK